MTNYLLDAVLVTTNCSAYTGSGECALARSIGYGYFKNSSDVVARYTELGKPYLSKWERLSDNMLLLGSQSNENILVVKTSYLEASNGLYYTDTSTPFNIRYTLTHFGISTWVTAGCNYVNEHMNSTNICAVRGMRLPSYTETHLEGNSSYNPCGSAGTSGGVPSFSEAYTWTSTTSTSGTSNYWVWRNSSSGDRRPATEEKYVRCVR